MEGTAIGRVYYGKEQGTWLFAEMKDACCAEKKRKADIVEIE